MTKFDPKPYIPTSGVKVFRQQWLFCPFCESHDLESLDTEYMTDGWEGVDGEAGQLDTWICENCDVLITYIIPPNSCVDYGEFDEPILEYDEDDFRHMKYTVFVEKRFGGLWDDEVSPDQMSLFDAEQPPIE